MNLKAESKIKLLCNEGNFNKAFELIVKTFTEKTYWQIRRMVLNHHDANDVLQEVLIKTWKGLPNFEWKSAFSTWLFRISHNEIINFLNSKYQKKSLSNSALVDLKLSHLQSDTYFDSTQANLIFQKAILQLPEKQQQVFNLRYFDELTYEQISEITGTSIGALKASYFHAVKKIEDFVKAN